MTRRPLTVLALTLLSLSASADVYKCRQPDGSSVISNNPCSDGGKTVKTVPSDTVSEENRAQAEKNADRLEEYADKLEAERLSKEEAERKERERQAAISAITPAGPSAASIQSCLQTLDRMALDPARRNDMENGCRTTGTVQPIYAPQPGYYGGPTYVLPPRQQPEPMPHPVRPAPITPSTKPLDLYQPQGKKKSR